MMHRIILFLILVLSGFGVFAQNRLEGTYYPLSHEFISGDRRIMVKPFVDGRAPFMINWHSYMDVKNVRVGFIDTTGKIVIKPVYFNCSNFQGGFALVQDSINQKGLIDLDGKLIIPFGRHDMSVCDNGLIIIQQYADRTSQLSIVDRKGHTIVPFGRYSTYGTSRPLYRENTMEADDTPRPWYLEYLGTVRFNKYLAVKAKEKCAVINDRGKEVIPPKFESIGSFVGDVAPFSADKKFGIIDATGRELIPPIYDNIALVDTGLSIAMQNKRSGLLSLNNKLLIPFNYNYISKMSDNAWLVCIGDHLSDTTKFGVVNIHDQVIIPIKRQFIEKFGSGYLIRNYTDGSAVFDSTGARKTAYIRYGRLNYPVWDMGQDSGYTVYNEKIRDFIHYDEVQNSMFRVGDKWGMLNSHGVEVTKPEFDGFELMEGNKAAIVKQNNKWHFIDNEGIKTINDEFDRIEAINDNLYLRVKKGDKYGLVSKLTYDLVLPVNYEQINVTHDRSDTYIEVSVNKKWGLFDGRYHEILPVRYDGIRWTGSGFKVMLGNKYGLTDARGKEIAPCIYDDIQITSPFNIVSKDKLYGLINRKGKVIVPVACQAIAYNWLNGKPILIMQRNGKTGMLDTAGYQFLPFKFDYAYPLSQYSNMPTEVLTVKNGGLTGVADLTGKILVPTLYEKLFPVSTATQKLYMVSLGDRYGIVNTAGKLLIPCIYANLGSVSDHSIVASTGEYHQFGVINWGNKPVIPFIYDQVQATGHGYITSLNRKWGAADMNGKEIIPMDYDYITSYFQNVFFLTKDRKNGIADETGKIILPVIYDALNTCGNETIQTTKDKLTGLIDYKGNIIYPCKYTYINCINGKVVEIY